MIKYVNNKEEFKEAVLTNKKPVLVDFFATWCPPCKMLTPVLEKIDEQGVSFDIVKVNIDEVQDLASEYKIEVVPTMLIFKDGVQMDKIVGFVDEDKIIDSMSNYN